MARQILGFDFGEKTVKIVYMVDEDVKKAITVDVPDNLMNNGVITAMDAMGNLIGQTLKENGIPRKNAAVILPAGQVYTRNVTMPTMTDTQMRYNLPFEFRDYLTNDKSEYIYDYEVLSSTTDSDGNVSLKLFVCAALKKTIDGYRRMFQRAGIKLAVAVPEEYALGKLVQNSKTAADGAVCLVDLGQTQTRIHMLKNGQYDTKRVLDFAMKDVEQAISEKKEADIHIAHTYMTANHENVLDLEECHDVYARIAVEVMRSLNFYKYNNQDVELNNLYLFGGGSEVGSMTQAITDATRMDAADVSALAEGLPEEQSAKHFLKAIGCALCG